MATQGFDRPVAFRDEWDDKTKHEVGFGEG